MQFDTEHHPSSAGHGFTLEHTLLRVKAPDGYWIEIVEAGRLKGLGR